MKKRILSLLLAFAMAATLAPATALVDTSVSEAATPVIEADLMSDNNTVIISGLTLSSSTSALQTYDLQANTTYKIKVVDTENSKEHTYDANSVYVGTYDVAQQSKTGAGGIDVTNGIGHATDQYNNNTANQVTTTEEFSGVVSFKTPVAEPNENIITLKVSAAFGKTTVGTPVDRYFRIRIAPKAETNLFVKNNGKEVVMSDAADFVANNAIKTWQGSSFVLDVNAVKTNYTEGVLSTNKVVVEADVQSGDNNNAISIEDSFGTGTDKSVDLVHAKTYSGESFTVKVDPTKKITGNDGSVVLKLTYKIDGDDDANRKTKYVSVKVNPYKVTVNNDEQITLNVPSGSTSASFDAIELLDADVAGNPAGSVDLNKYSDYKYTVKNTQAENNYWPGISGQLAINKENNGNNWTVGTALKDYSFTDSKATIKLPANLINGTYLFDVVVGTGNGMPTEVADRTIKVRVIVGDAVTFTLDADGGVIDSVNWELKSGTTSTYEGKLAKNQIYTLPTPVKPGYVFKGWTKSGNLFIVTNSTVADADTVLKASWTLQTDGITLDAGHVSGVTGDTNRSVVGKVGEKLEVPQFKRDGYTFEGWSTEPNATVVMYPNKATITTDMLNAIKSADNGNTLFAVWKAKTYTIVFDSALPAGHSLDAYSSPVANATKTFGKNITNAKWWGSVAKNTYSSTDLVFMGWSTAKGVALDTITDYDDIIGIDGNDVTDFSLNNVVGNKTSVTLYAVWANTAKTTLHSEEKGSSFFATLPDVKYSQGKVALDYELPRVTSKIGYVVDKWVTADEREYRPGYSATNEELWPVYDKNLVNYVIDYDAPINADGDTLFNGYIANAQRGAFTVVDGVIKLGEVKSETYEYMGYYISICDKNGALKANLRSDYSETENTNVAGDLFKSYDAAKLAAAVEAYNTAAYTTAPYASDAYVEVTPLLLPKVNNAEFKSNKVTVDYATPLSVVSDLVNPVLLYTMPGIGTTPIEGDATVRWTNASVYKSTTPGTYNLTGIIVPGSNVSATGLNYRTFSAAVTVRAKTPSNAVFVTDIDSIADIKLPLGSTTDDVYAALSDINKVGVTAETGKKYTVKDITVRDYYNGDDGGNSDWKYNGKSAASQAFVRTNRTEKYTDNSVFYFRANLKAIDKVTGLSYVDSADPLYDNKYAYVTVYVGAVPTPSTPESIEELTDTTITTEAQARTLLEQNYLLRFRNKVTGEHLYTADWTEYVSLMANKNWEMETWASGNNTFKASSTRTTVFNTPVYRLFSAIAQEHVYTKDMNEVTQLVGSGKWTLDNSTIYVSMDDSGVPYYRQVRVILINKKAALQHNYAPKAEFDYNNAHGWTADFNSEPVWYSPAN